MAFPLSPRFIQVPLGSRPHLLQGVGRGSDRVSSLLIVIQFEKEIDEMLGGTFYSSRRSHISLCRLIRICTAGARLDHCHWLEGDKEEGLITTQRGHRVGRTVEHMR